MKFETKNYFPVLSFSLRVILIAGLSSIQSGNAGAAEFSLCDCVSKEMNSDAMMMACSKLFRSLSRAELSRRKNACAGATKAELSFCDCVDQYVNHQISTVHCSNLIDQYNEYELTREYLDCRR